jgi:hypothetical protein
MLQANDCTQSLGVRLADHVRKVVFLGSAYRLHTPICLYGSRPVTCASYPEDTDVCGQN